MPIDYDSILTATEPNIINQTEFYKQGIALPDCTVAMSARPYAMGEDDYMVACMVMMFFILAVIMYHSRTNFLYQLKDLFTPKRQHTEERIDRNTNDTIRVVLLITVSAFSVSLLFLNNIIQQNCNHLASGTPYGLFAAGGIFCVCVIYAKAWLYALVNWVFFDTEASKRWMSNYLLITALSAFILYPIALIDVFSTHSQHGSIMTPIILIAVLYEFLLFYKLITNFKMKKHGYLLIFLYFCTVEMLPAFVLWHLTTWCNDSVTVKNLIY